MSSRLAEPKIIDFDPNTSMHGRTKIAFRGASIKIVNGDGWRCFSHRGFRAEDLEMTLHGPEPRILRNYHEGGLKTTLWFEKLDGTGTLVSVKVSA